MNFLQAIILGIVEGITEFLPISSTGHLILVSELMRLADSEFLKSFEIVIQLGAILAVVFLYWKRIITNASLFLKLCVAFLPTAIIGLVAYPYVKEYLLDSNAVVLWSLFLGGIAIYLFEIYHDPKSLDVSQMTYKQAFVIGLAQSVAMVPGVSRAAATIVCGVLLGFNRKSVVEFSFMLAIPTMIAASGLDLIRSPEIFRSGDSTALAVGLVAAFLTALLAVKWLLKYIETNNFKSFGIYRIALAIAFWLFLF